MAGVPPEREVFPKPWTDVRVLVACEESQAVMAAFRRVGIPATSCDIDECSGAWPEYHVQGNALTEMRSGKYTAMIGHPPCTYLSNAGSKHLYSRKLNEDGKVVSVINQERYKKLLKAREFFMAMWETDIRFIALENPIYVKVAKLPHHSQQIQPYEFGHPFSKATRLWLKGLPLLKPTKIIPKHRVQQYMKMAHTKRQRSKTFLGVARAMAEQWGPVIAGAPFPPRIKTLITQQRMTAKHKATIVSGDTSSADEMPLSELSKHYNNRRQRATTSDQASGDASGRSKRRRRQTDKDTRTSGSGAGSGAGSGSGSPPGAVDTNGPKPMGWCMLQASSLAPLSASQVEALPSGTQAMYHLLTNSYPEPAQALHALGLPPVFSAVLGAHLLFSLWRPSLEEDSQMYWDMCQRLTAQFVALLRTRSGAERDTLRHLLEQCSTRPAGREQGAAEGQFIPHHQNHFVQWLHFDDATAATWAAWRFPWPAHCLSCANSGGNHRVVLPHISPRGAADMIQAMHNRVVTSMPFAAYELLMCYIQDPGTGRVDADRARALVQALSTAPPSIRSNVLSVLHEEKLVAVVADTIIEHWGLEGLHARLSSRRGGRTQVPLAWLLLTHHTLWPFLVRFRQRHPRAFDATLREPRLYNRETYLTKLIKCLAVFRLETYNPEAFLTQVLSVPGAAEVVSIPNTVDGETPAMLLAQYFPRVLLAVMARLSPEQLNTTAVDGDGMTAAMVAADHPVSDDREPHARVLLNMVETWTPEQCASHAGRNDDGATLFALAIKRNHKRAVCTMLTRWSAAGCASRTLFKLDTVHVPVALLLLSQDASWHEAQVTMLRYWSLRDMAVVPLPHNYTRSLEYQSMSPVVPAWLLFKVMLEQHCHGGAAQEPQTRTDVFKTWIRALGRSMESIDRIAHRILRGLPHNCVMGQVMQHVSWDAFRSVV